MENFSPSDLKAILHSKRANVFYLEHCRVMQKDGRVLYLTEAKKENLYFNIPIANTTVILLGTGTSITQAAVRMLCQAYALVFDVADLIKDAIVLPWAFFCAREQATEQEFRQQCLQSFTDHKALEFMFDQVKAMALESDWKGQSACSLRERNQWWLVEKAISRNSAVRASCLSRVQRTVPSESRLAANRCRST